MRCLLIAMAFLGLMAGCWSAVIATAAFAEDAPAPVSPVAIAGTFEALEWGKQNATINLEADREDHVYSVTDAEVTSKLRQAVSGDGVTFMIDAAKTPPIITRIVELHRPTSGSYRVGAIVASLLVVWSAAKVMRWHSPKDFLVGVDGRYSNSQTQLAVWFAALAAVYGATLLLRIFYLGIAYVGGIEIPQNLLLVSGLSAFSYGGAKVITLRKTQTAAAEGVADGGKPGAPAGAARLTDLVQNDRSNADLGDFQMILVTAIAALIFVISGFEFLSRLQLSSTISLPDIDSTLLSGFGIGQGAYLVKKAALPPGDG